MLMLPGPPAAGWRPMPARLRPARVRFPGGPMADAGAGLRARAGFRRRHETAHQQPSQAKQDIRQGPCFQSETRASALEPAASDTYGSKGSPCSHPDLSKPKPEQRQRNSAALFTLLVQSTPSHCATRSPRLLPQYVVGPSRRSSAAGAQDRHSAKRMPMAPLRQPNRIDADVAKQDVVRCGTLFMLLETEAFKSTAPCTF